MSLKLHRCGKGRQGLGDTPAMKKLNCHPFFIVDRLSKCLMASNFFFPSNIAAVDFALFTLRWGGGFAANLSSNFSMLCTMLACIQKTTTIYGQIWFAWIFNLGRFWICKRLLLFFCIDVSIWQMASCPLLCNKLEILELRPWGTLWIFTEDALSILWLLLRENDANAKNSKTLTPAETNSYK